MERINLLEQLAELIQEMSDEELFHFCNIIRIYNGVDPIPNNEEVNEDC